MLAHVNTFPASGPHRTCVVHLDTHTLAAQQTKSDTHSAFKLHWRFSLSVTDTVQMAETFFVPERTYVICL